MKQTDEGDTAEEETERERPLVHTDRNRRGSITAAEAAEGALVVPSRDSGRPLYDCRIRGPNGNAFESAWPTRE